MDCLGKVQNPRNIPSSNVTSWKNQKGWGVGWMFINFNHFSSKKAFIDLAVRGAASSCWSIVGSRLHGGLVFFKYLMTVGNVDVM
jgi:hypothetical protein